MGEFKKWNVNGRNSRIYVKLDKILSLERSDVETYIDLEFQSWTGPSHSSIQVLFIVQISKLKHRKINSPMS